MFRLLDLLFSIIGLVIGLPLIVVLIILGWFDSGSPLFKQQRVGLHKKPFILVKFRTMRADTESVASHLADSSAITSYGRILRRTKLDELPQLFNVMKGEMSLVGPRPCLFNQNELIEARDTLGVFEVRPGITGLAQINNVDMSEPEKLAQMDARMIDSLNIRNYLKYLLLTILGKGSGDRVRN